MNDERIMTTSFPDVVSLTLKTWKHILTLGLQVVGTLRRRVTFYYS